MTNFTKHYCPYLECLKPFINEPGLGVISYFDLTNRKVIILDDFSGEEVSGEDFDKNNLVELPYRVNAKPLAWKYFYQMLDDKALSLVNGFTDKRGFFTFLREHGLDCVYDEAMDQAIDRLLDLWCHKYGIIE